MRRDNDSNGTKASRGGLSRGQLLWRSFRVARQGADWRAARSLDGEHDRCPNPQCNRAGSAEDEHCSVCGVPLRPLFVFLPGTGVYGKVLVGLILVAASAMFSVAEARAGKGFGYWILAGALGIGAFGAVVWGVSAFRNKRALLVYDSGLFLIPLRGRQEKQAIGMEELSKLTVKGTVSLGAQLKEDDVSDIVIQTAAHGVIEIDVDEFKDTKRLRHLFYRWASS